jgi:hypothetical protein
MSRSCRLLKTGDVYNLTKGGKKAYGSLTGINLNFSMVSSPPKCCKMPNLRKAPEPMMMSKMPKKERPLEEQHPYITSCRMTIASSKHG